MLKNISKIIATVGLSVLALNAAHAEQKTKELPPPQKFSVEDVVGLNSIPTPDEIKNMCDWTLSKNELRNCFKNNRIKLLWMKDLSELYASVQENLTPKNTLFPYEQSQLKAEPAKPSKTTPVKKPRYKKPAVKAKPVFNIAYAGMISDEAGATGIALFNNASSPIVAGSKVGPFKVINFNEKCMTLSNKKKYCTN